MRAHRDESLAIACEVSSVQMNFWQARAVSLAGLAGCLEVRIRRELRCERVGQLQQEQGQGC